jgi:glucose-6-phosphate 1-dehydrogenase
MPARRRRPLPRRALRVPRPPEHVVVLFGATGDLARRKLLPGAFHLYRAGLLPRRFRIIGSSPLKVAVSDADFREHAREATAEFGIAKPRGEAWRSFARHLHFAGADADDASQLVDAVARAEKEIRGHPRRLFQLAVPPAAFRGIIEMLGSTGLANRGRVIIEKPFGTDLASAKELNAVVHAVFDESSVFRIDHFLGKESVDNILAFRFANGLFEPVWNRLLVDYIQIDVPETLSVGSRAGFYEGIGAYRDMVVTHLFQVLSFVAMEPPTSLEEGPLRQEKRKVFDSLAPIDPRHVVRGQYVGYQREEGVAKGSQTETFVAVKAEIENWRWEGVPIYLRTGKNLAASRQLVAIGFKQPPLKLFERSPLSPRADEPNLLVIDFADPGSISIRFQVKEPGAAGGIAPAALTFSYASSFSQAVGLEGYERLIHLAMLGDQTYFTAAGAVERLWEISEPLLKRPPKVEAYEPGAWGPQSIDRLVAPHRWFLPERN